MDTQVRETSDTILVRCGDGDLNEVHEEHFPGAHNVAIPGTVYEIHHEVAMLRMAAGNISAYVDRKHATRVVITTHTGCARYKMAYGDEGFDRDLLIRDAKEVADKLRFRFPANKFPLLRFEVYCLELVDGKWILGDVELQL